ncbi:MAG: dipeptide epimerase [Acidobacteriota bacterium]
MIHLRYRTINLELKHTFRLSRGATDSRQNLIIELEHDGLVGLGEAAPISRYDQDCASAADAVATMVRGIEDPKAFELAARSVAIDGQPAAEAAVDMALRDLAGKRFGVPLYELMGIPPQPAPPTSFTLGMDRPDAMTRRVEEAEAFPVLKVKMGSDDDRPMLEAVRRVTRKPIRIDANEGWTLDDAITRLEWLQQMGVELVEQPLPADQLDQTRELRHASPLPLIADESVGTSADIPRLAGVFDGINIKLMKCGGIGEALRMIAVARAHGLKVMLGCMIESSLSITAAAHLAPLVDYLDLDGHLLIKQDPFVGALFEQGRLSLPEGPGLGVAGRSESGQ